MKNRDKNKGRIPVLQGFITLFYPHVVHAAWAGVAGYKKAFFNIFNSGTAIAFFAMPC